MKNAQAVRDASDKSPAYRRIIDTLVERINQGVLRPGDTAPSESDLIAEFRVSSTTARRCLNEMAQQGLMTRVQGKGTFVSDGANILGVSHVGVLYHDLVDLTNSFAASLVRGIHTGLSHGRHHPVLLPVGQVLRGKEPAGTLRALVRRFGLKGLLVASPVPAEWLGPLLDDGVPVCAINFSYEDPRVDHVLGESYHAVESLLTRAAELGHTQALILRGVFEERLLQGVRMMPTPTPQVPGIAVAVETFSYFEPQEVTRKVTAALAGRQRPTLLIPWGYEAVLEASHAITSLGWKVPEDVSLAFVGAPSGPTRFSGAHVPIDQIADLASRRLLQRLDSYIPLEPVGPIASLFIPGVTLAPVAASSAR